MIKINSPISILEFSSTHIYLNVYDKAIMSQNSFYEEKINYTKDDNLDNEKPLINIIRKAEKDLDQHLNEIILIIDSPSIHSIDFSIKKNYDKKLISNIDIEYITNECEKIIRSNYQDKDVLHIVKSFIFFDDNLINDIEKYTNKVSQVTIEFKFLMIEKRNINYIKNLFYKNHISLKNVFCTSYVKSLGLINKNNISGLSSFIDIGYNKSSLSIFDNNTLIYFNNTHIGGNHITKDISKILKIDYRKAEAQKFKFSKKNSQEIRKELTLLNQIINARLEEIVELLFLNCPLLKQNIFNSDLRLYFTGNGSKVLNENLLSFGPEFKFISEMSIIDESKKDACYSALNFLEKIDQKKNLKPMLNLEKKGYFERLFDFFSRK